MTLDKRNINTFNSVDICFASNFLIRSAGDRGRPETGERGGLPESVRGTWKKEWISSAVKREIEKFLDDVFRRFKRSTDPSPFFLLWEPLLFPRKLPFHPSWRRFCFPRCSPVRSHFTWPGSGFFGVSGAQISSFRALLERCVCHIMPHKMIVDNPSQSLNFSTQIVRMLQLDRAPPPPPVSDGFRY